jgi:hypothetical protein
LSAFLFSHDYASLPFALQVGTLCQAVDGLCCGKELIAAIYLQITMFWKGFTIQIIPAIFEALAISGDFGELAAILEYFLAAGVCSCYHAAEAAGGK